MAVVRSRTFRSGNSQVVRLPREVAFGAEVPVTIVRSGEVVTIYPTRVPIQDMIERLAALPKPSAIETRDEEPPPERPGV